MNLNTERNSHFANLQTAFVRIEAFLHDLVTQLLKLGIRAGPSE